MDKVAEFLGPFQQNEIDSMKLYLRGLADYISNSTGAPAGQQQVLRQYGVVSDSIGTSLVYGDAWQFQVEQATAIPLAAVPDFKWFGIGAYFRGRPDLCGLRVSNTPSGSVELQAWDGDNFQIQKYRKVVPISPNEVPDLFGV